MTLWLCSWLLFVFTTAVSAKIALTAAPKILAFKVLRTHRSNPIDYLVPLHLSVTWVIVAMLSKLVLLFIPLNSLGWTHFVLVKMSWR